MQVFLAPFNPSFNLSPLTFLKPFTDLRVGACSIAQKWEERAVTLTDQPGESVWEVEKGVLANDALVSFLKTCGAQEVYYQNQLLARKSDGSGRVDFLGKVNVVKDVYDLITVGKQELENDLNEVLFRKVEVVDGFGDNPVYIDPDAKVQNAVLNSDDGPIFLAKGAKVLDGSVIYGPAFIGEESVVGAQALFRGGVSLGRKCVVSGELKNVQFQDCSNKGHYGYLGDSLIGSCCNLGAGTVSSNLKNNWGELKLWSFEENKSIQTKHQKVGLVMGDFTTTAVSSVFYTGITLGVFVNAFADKPIRNKYWRSFSWGEIDVYKLDKAITFAEKFLLGKGEVLTAGLRQKISDLYEKVAGLEKTAD